MNALILPTIKSDQKQNVKMEDLDFDTLSRIKYPVGSSYISFDASLDPNTFLYGKWELCQNDKSLLYGSDMPITENSSVDNSKIVTEKSKETTGATAIDVSQMGQHKHKYMYTTAIKKSSSGIEFRVVSNFSENTDDWEMVYSGSGGSHTHHLNNHTHNINIPSYGIYMWIRKE